MLLTQNLIKFVLSWFSLAEKLTDQHSAMNSLLPSLSVLFRNSKRSFMYGSMAAITIGLEELFECVVFSCPCEGHFAYGLAFLWFPTLLLFLPGILLERSLWRYPRKTNEDSAQKLTCRYLKTLFAALDVFIRVSIAPAAWLVLSFLQQQYYACAYFGPSLESAAATTNTSDKCHFAFGARSKQLEENYKTRSQIVGWWLMMIAMSILFTSICIRRCIDKRKRLRLPSVEYYHHVAAKEALERFHTKAKELAKQKATEDVESFFQSANNSDCDAYIEGVSKNVLAKYGASFVIPPESPSYDAVAELFLEQTDGAERDSLKELDSHTKLEHIEFSKQRKSAQTELNNNRASLSRVKLCRQI